MFASNILLTIALMALAYLLGSVPFSYLVARINGIDLHEVGSGNIGGANVWRSCGFGPFVIAAAGDILKGMLLTLVALHIAKLSPGEVMLVGVAAILGHTFSIFLNFTGGKAVATSTGVLLAVFPVLIVFGVIAWLIAFGLTRMSSVGSLTGAAVELVLATVLYAWGQLPLAYAIFIWVAGAFIVYLHRQNIQRLLAGTENRFGKLF
jgi:acyl phosphate:glycerol-3-phosphate acyltransferase